MAYNWRLDVKPLKFAIDYIAKIGLPLKLWRDVKDCVGVAEKTGLDGKAKKALARERLLHLGYDLAEGLIDTVLQLGWLWLQAYLGREFKITLKGKEL